MRGVLIRVWVSDDPPVSSLKGSSFSGAVSNAGGVTPPPEDRSLRRV